MPRTGGLVGRLLSGWLAAGVPAGADHTVKLWDPQTGRLVTSLEGHHDRVRSLVFSPDGRTLASAGHDRAVLLWDMTAESRPLSVNFRALDRRNFHFFERMQLPNDDFSRDVLKGHAGDVTCLAFSPNGRTLVSGSRDTTLRLWNLAELERRFSLRGHEKTVNCLVISRDGRTMLSASNDRTARVWDVSTMRQIGAPLEHERLVLAAALSSDGKAFATGSMDGTVRARSSGGG